MGTLGGESRLAPGWCPQPPDKRHFANYPAIAFFTACAFLLSIIALHAASLEYEIKAAYILKLAQFVDWPPSSFVSAYEPFDICIVGDDPFGSVIDEISRGEEMNSHPTEIVRMRAFEPKSDCKILFAAGSATESVESILAAVANEPLLTVTDGVPGGLVELVVQEGRVRFAIDESRAAANGIPVSSKLLALAVTVR